MTHRTVAIGGNWKMNLSRREAVELARAVAASLSDLEAPVQVTLYPPFPYLIPVGEALAGSPVRLGAQDLHPAASGAYTGEVSAAMLRDIGVVSVLTGHSERRHDIGETPEFVGRKTHAALSAGLETVLCVGELLEEREVGRTEEIVIAQLDAGLSGVTADLASRLIIAYEPVWAIGTGRTARPGDAQAVHAAIRSWVREQMGDRVAASLRIEYGGSVKPATAPGLASEPDIDGFLVGGASLSADDFHEIIRAAVAARSPVSP